MEMNFPLIKMCIINFKTSVKFWWISISKYNSLNPDRLNEDKTRWSLTMIIQGQHYDHIIVALRDHQVLERDLSLH